MGSCGHQRESHVANAATEKPWQDESWREVQNPLISIAFLFLVKTQDYRFWIGSSVLQKWGNYSCLYMLHVQSQSVAEGCLQQKSSGAGWTWVTTQLPKEGRGAKVCVTAYDIQSRWIHKPLWEFSSLVSQQNRNLLLAWRSTSLGLSDSLGASLCREFLLQEDKSRRNRKVLYKLGCAQVAGFQCCCYFNYSNKQET